MQQGILLFTANSSPDDLETWRACFQRMYKYAEQGAALDEDSAALHPRQ